MKANFKEWEKGQKVKGKYLGMVEYEGIINGDRSRWAPKGNTFIFVVTLTKELTIFGKTKKVGDNIEIWESDTDDSTIEKIEEQEEKPEIVKRLDVYEQVLESEIAKDIPIDAAHNHACCVAGLTDTGLIKARSMTGQPATFKPGIWPRIEY